MDNSSTDISKTRLTHTLLSGPFPGNDNLLEITRICSCNSNGFPQTKRHGFTTIFITLVGNTTHSNKSESLQQVKLLSMHYALCM